MHFIGLFYPWGLILQAIAVVHFFRRRPQAYWFWVIIFLGGLGALIYIGVEVIPDLGLLRGAMQRMSHRRKIRGLEALVLENPAVGNREELADLCLEDRRYARARELYDQVISKRTDTLDPFYRRGLAALALSDAPAAVADFERVVRQDPKYDFNRAIGLFAHALALAGQTDRADAVFKQATEVSTLSETCYNYASFLAGQKRTAEAREWAERILARRLTIPLYLRRRERPWFQKTKALLKKLK